MDNNQFGGSDPFVGAKRHKQVTVSRSGDNTQIETANDITKSKMFQELFGSSTAAAFQKMEAKKQMEKPKVVDLGLKSMNTQNTQPINQTPNKSKEEMYQQNIKSINEKSVDELQREAEKLLKDQKENKKDDDDEHHQEEKGGTEMIEDQNDDLDSVFESGNEIQMNDVSTNEDLDLIDSFMAKDEDYGTSISETIVEDEKDEDDEMDLIDSSDSEPLDKETLNNIVNESETKTDSSIIQSAEDYMQEIVGNSEDDDNEESEAKDDESSDIKSTDEYQNLSDEDKLLAEKISKEIDEIQEESEDDNESEDDILNSMIDSEVNKIAESSNDQKNDNKSTIDLNDDEEDDDEDEIVSETTKTVNSIEEETENESKSETIDSYDDFKRNMFWKTVEEYKQKYTEDGLVNYLERFQNDDNNRKVINDMYTEIIIQYADQIDFAKDEEGRNNAWLIVSGKFADLIERRKEMGLIESTVETTNLGKSNTTINPDPNIEMVLEDRRKFNEKKNKYAIDRTVFAIADDDAEDDISPFEDRKAIDREFYESPFYKILKEVMTSDRCANMSQIYMKVIINPDTSFIPVVDFSTGVRFVCIDTSDVDQYQIHALALTRDVPFSFTGTHRRDVRNRVLYSDECVNRPVATIFAIKKLVAGARYWNKKHVITLKHNFAVAYTTENQFVEMFENGDPDSKNPENCVNITRKPKTQAIGIIALDKKSTRDRQAMRRKQGKKVLERMANGGWYENNDVNINDYNIHFVLSADLICNDRSLVDPTVSPENRYVRYQITRYCECNSVIILDGIQTICTAIVKEHFKKYGRNTRYSIEFEYDPTELLTPGVMDIISSDSIDKGIEPSQWRRTNPMSIVSTYIMPPSRLKMEGVLPSEKGRVDARNFNPATLAANYPRELYSRYDINTNEGRADFLRSRGFLEFWQPAIATFDIMPYVLRIIENGDFINEITDVNVASLSDRDSRDIDNLLYQQQKLEYIKKLDKSGVGSFQKFLLSVLDYFIDSQDQK